MCIKLQANSHHLRLEHRHVGQVAPGRRARAFAREPGLRLRILRPVEWCPRQLARFIRPVLRHAQYPQRYNVMRDPGEKYGELYPGLFAVTPIQITFREHMKMIQKFPHRVSEVTPKDAELTPHD